MDAAEAKENTEEAKADEDLALAKKQVDEYKNLAMYLRADLENYKKRASREREDYVKYANESLILELLDVYENLERAVGTAKKSDESMARGLEMIHANLKAVLEKHGLKPIPAVGEKFDPYRHEAILREVDDDL